MARGDSETFKNDVRNHTVQNKKYISQENWLNNQHNDMVLFFAKYLMWGSSDSECDDSHGPRDPQE